MLTRKTPAMSLHADLSPEALRALRQQKRNSTLSSVLIAVLTVVLVALILGALLLPQLAVTKPPVVVISTPLPQDDPPDPVLPRINLHHKPSSAPAAMNRVNVAQTADSLAIPTMEIPTHNESMEFGESDSIGEAWPDDGIGKGNDGIPPPHQKRCSRPDRLARIMETGGTEACEDAVVKALDWLKNTQNSDGSWTNANQTAMTGLALLAYLGHCETPLSKDYGDTVLRAIVYLVDVGMKNKGRLSLNPANGQNFCYEHAIATYALAEAATFCRIERVNVPNLFGVTQMAGQFIIDNQHKKSGGWDYGYDTEGARGGDLSVTAWQIQALKACQHTGLEFKGLQRAANKATEYVSGLRCQDGGFAYAKADESPHGGDYRTLTGAGLLSLQMFDKGSGAAARGAVRYIGKNTRFDYKSGFADLYGHYYEAQAMMNRGGADWKKYNGLFRDQLLRNQSPDGSWPPPGAAGKVRAVGAQFMTNVHYRTCLNTLTLEVYYRFLPGTGRR